jgi:TetR/AcrR family transcriptional regulator, regulator of autoinduction and epiphytic fitness
VPPAATDSVDPRIVRTREVVCAAALAELAAVGFADFTIEGVAARAGVGKSTIYRHWGGHLDLITDALVRLNRQPSPDPVDGDVRARVGQLLHHLATVMADPAFSAAIPALIDAAEHHPSIAAVFHDYSAQRRGTLVATLRAGVDAGELPEDLDPELTALALSGPIFYRRLMTDTPFPTDDVPALVTTVLGTAGRTPAGAGPSAAGGDIGP